jgi:hypothetical protein
MIHDGRCGGVARTASDWILVNHQGTVFEKDFGPKTARSAARMTAFEPDNSWRKVTNGGVPRAGAR